MNERELLLALFNAIGALTLSLTGQRMLLCIEDGHGNVAHFYPDETKVTLSPAEPATPAYPSSGHSSMRCALHDGLDAKPRELPPIVRRAD